MVWIASENVAPSHQEFQSCLVRLGDISHIATRILQKENHNTRTPLL